MRKCLTSLLVWALIVPSPERTYSYREPNTTVIQVSTWYSQEALAPALPFARFSHLWPLIVRLLHEFRKSGASDITEPSQLRRPLSSGAGSPFASESARQLEIRQHLERRYGLRIIQPVTVVEGGIGSIQAGFALYSVETDKGSAVYRPLFPERLREKARYDVAFIQRLSDYHIPVPRIFPIPGASGPHPSDAYLDNFEGRLCVLEDRMERGRFIRRTEATPQHYRSLGELAANIHLATRNFDPKAISIWKDRRTMVQEMRPETLEALRDQLERKKNRSELLSEPERYFLSEAEEILRAFTLQRQRFIDRYTPQLESKFLDVRAPGLPNTGHIHNDLKFGNVAFDEQGRVTGVIDFNMAQIDHAHAEFYGPMLGAEDYGEVPEFDEHRLQYLLEGYRKKVSVTDEEMTGLWEFLRGRLVENVFRYLTADSRLNVFHHSEQLQRLRRDVETLKKFPDHWQPSTYLGTPPLAKFLSNQEISDSRGAVLGSYGIVHWTPASERPTRYAYLKFKPSPTGITAAIVIDPEPQDKLIPVDRATNYVAWRQKDNREAVVGHLPIHQQKLKPLDWFISQAERLNPTRRKAIASSGNENLYWNQGVWSYSHGTIYGYPPAGTPPEQSPMLVLWDDGRISIERNVRYEFDSPHESATRAKIIIDDKDQSPSVREATFVQLILNHGQFESPAQHLSWFDDLRHLFMTPRFSHDDLSAIPSDLMSGAVFFGISQLEEHGRHLAAPAISGPVRLRMEMTVKEHRPDGSASSKTIGVERALLSRKLNDLGYAQSDSVDLPGQYRFPDERTIEIFFRGNPYPLNVVGTTPAGEFINVAIGGRSGQAGATIAEAASLMNSLGCDRAGIVDQGVSTRLTINDQHLVIDPVRAPGGRSIKMTSAIVYTTPIASLSDSSIANHQVHQWINSFSDAEFNALLIDFLSDGGSAGRRTLLWMKSVFGSVFQKVTPSWIRLLPKSYGREIRMSA